MLLMWCGTAAAAEQARTASRRAVDGAKLVENGVEDGRITLLTGRSTIISTAHPYKRLSIADPDVAAARPVGIDSVLLTPKKPGLTQLILWDEQDRSQMLDVVVQADMQMLREQLKTLFPDTQIQISNAAGSIVLHGRVGNARIAEQAALVASPYGKVLNLLEVSGGRQVMLQVRFAEVSRSATSALGVNFGFSDGRSFGAVNVGQVAPLGIKEFKDEALGLGLQSPGPAASLFGKAAVGDSALAYFVEALRQNNLLRILAEPNLMTTSGERASFLAGGKFPVPITQGGGSGVGTGPAITVEYREFGVRLNFTPVVLGDGRIKLTVNPEVSDLDFTTAVRFNGFVVPGLTTREVTTTIELAEGQTFAIAGLLNSNVTASKDVVPLVGDLPVVGALFRSVRYQRRETELVVLVTPRLVGAMNPGQVPPLPGEKWRHPLERDLFLKADLGGPLMGEAVPGPGREPPRFYGQTGFTPVDVGAKKGP